MLFLSSHCTIRKTDCIWEHMCKVKEKLTTKYGYVQRYVYKIGSCHVAQGSQGLQWARVFLVDLVPQVHVSAVLFIWEGLYSQLKEIFLE